MSDRGGREVPELEPGAPRGSGPSELPAPPRLRDYTRLPLLIAAAMFLAGALVYPSLPVSVPTHWGVSGVPDAFSPKSFGSVFFEPMVAVGIYALLVFAPYLDPKRRNLKLSLRAYNTLIDVVVGMQAVIFAATIFAAFDNRFDVVKVVLISVGLLFAVVGNYLTTVKQNWTFGVRDSWTLSDDVVWRKTNRVGGYLFVAAGVITVIAALLPARIAFFVLMGSVLVVVAVTYVYSYLLFRSRHPEA